jgi:uncharacterized protein (DUF1499 family)
MFDFALLKRPSSPNTYLVAPAGFAEGAKPDAVAPCFAVDAPRLASAIERIALAEARTKLAAKAATSLHFTHTSAVFRFVDDIFVEIIGVSASETTLAIYSRSRTGYSDMGVNRQRVTRWLEALGRAATQKT